MNYSRLASLKDKSLYRPAAFINGSFIEPTDRSFDLFDPATSEKICSLPDLGEDETSSAIEAAKNAFPEWRAKTAKERSMIMKKWADLILENKDDLATILTAESGKPITESHGEILYGTSFIEWFAEEAKRIYGDIIPEPLPGRKVFVFKEPIGVAALITPWNFPNAMITRKAAAALSAGCTVVIKPAAETPLSATAICELANRAGIPKGVINIVTCSADRIVGVGKTLTTSPDVKKVSFTGSTGVGKLLMSQAASTVKKVSLELGGNAPFIVFDDADVANAVDGCISSKFRNTGQTCVCVNRIYVQDKVYDEFTKLLVEKVKAFKIDSPFSKLTQVGPLINKNAVDKVEKHVQDAVAKGARVLVGGNRLTKMGENWFEPTVLVNVPTNCLVSSEETFGPVAAVFKFSTEEEVVRLANDTPFGLAGYFYSNDMSRCFRVAQNLEVGMVGVNETLISTEVAPFGGVKESGLGREGSKYGLDDYIEVKYVCLGGLKL